MDRDVSLKEAVQSRTVFLTEVESWHDVLPLLTPKVQTMGIAFRTATTPWPLPRPPRPRRGRCVRPGLMNNDESPWDGKLLLNELVRWFIVKP